MDANLIRNVNDPYEEIVNLLNKRNIKYIDFKTWDRINEYELE